MLLGKVLKSSAIIASITIKDKEALYTLYTPLSIPVEMLDPFEPNLIISPVILTHSNTPVLWQIVVDIPDCLIKLCL